MVSRTGIAFALTFGILLTSCTPAKLEQTPNQPSVQPTLPPATSVPTAEPVGVGVPVIDYLNGRNELLVISPMTGKDLDALTPIPLGENYNQAFSPDGQTLALVSDGQLYVIDLPSWKYHTSNVDIHGWLSTVVFSPDGTLLALASGDSDGTFRLVDVRNGGVKASVQAGFSIRNIKFTADGKAIMVYGPQIASTGDAANAGVSIGAPQAALLALPDLRMLWSVKLEGIRDGSFPKDPATANTQHIYDPGAAWHFQPGVAFDPNRDVVYIVHGDDDKLTTVDFTHRKVSTVEVQARTSWLDQLLALTAGVAYAKGMDGTTKQAVISTDGKYLFVTGNTEAVSQPVNGDFTITDTPIGLQIIATADGTLLKKPDTEASSAALSPDGRQVLLTGWNKNDSYGTPWTEVYDISTGSIIKHLDHINLIATRNLEGKPILVSSSLVSNHLYYMASVDPATWSILSDWNGPDDIGWLVDP